MSDAAVQPWLGEECLWPERPDVVCLVSEKRWLKTGKIIGKNEQLCRAVCIDLLVGELSQRQIADRYGIGRGSIRAIEDIMRARGELEPLSKVVRAELGRAIVLGLWRWNEGLLDGTVHPGQVPIPTAALIDKRAQLEAGIVPGTQRTTGEVTVEQLRAEIAMARALQAPAGDSQADAGSLKLDQISSASGSDTGMDTAGPHRTGPTPGAAGDLDAAGGGSGLGAVPDGGGGIDRSPTTRILDGIPRKVSSLKAPFHAFEFSSPKAPLFPLMKWMLPHHDQHATHGFAGTPSMGPERRLFASRVWQRAGSTRKDNA